MVGSSLSSTEIYSSASKAFTVGMELPMPLSGHCMISLNSTHSVLTGGYDGRSWRREAYIANIALGTWTEIAHMNEFRSSHACGWAKKSGETL